MPATIRAFFGAVLLALSAASGAAESGRLMVLDFALNDDTLLPRVADEIARTGAVAPTVRALLEAHGRALVLAPAHALIEEQAANGYRYIVDHPAAIAAIAREAGADWVAVGRVNKPSFLFAYLVIDLIDARSGRAVAHLETSPRGSMRDRHLQRRAAEDLALDLEQALATLTGTASTAAVEPTAGVDR